MDMSNLYSGVYVDATYGADGMGRTFERVLALPPDRSDNAARVERVVEFATIHLTAAPSCSTWDRAPACSPIGCRPQGGRSPPPIPTSGPCATPARPSGVDALHADFLTAGPATLATHDVVTFNKVLEHVPDPVAMLGGATRC